MLPVDFSQAQMIAADDSHQGAPLMRTVFRLDQPVEHVAQATLHATALGIFEPFCNGQRVGEDVLSPGWTSYEWRLRFRSYEVTSLLSDETVIGFAMGNGWAAGQLAFQGKSHFYTDEVGLLATVVITYVDGSSQIINSNTSWQAAGSQTTANDIYDGQTIDARLPMAQWSTTQPDPAILWGGVHAMPFDQSRLVEPIGPLVIRHESLLPQQIWASPSGKTLVDFGQNLVGWVRLQYRGEPGQTIVIRHAEVLEDGELGTRPLREAKATDTFICSGGDDIFEPTKTFHGFRYIEVTGLPDLASDSSEVALEAVVVHSDLRRIGTFECSDELLNQLHRNVVWGQRGNFLDIPTDCPQRNERLGWTGDIAAFAPTAVFNFDVAAFLQEWLANMAVEQAAGAGVIPFVVPDVLKMTEQISDDLPESTCLWSDAGCWVPWALWNAYGDVSVLHDSMPIMTAHLRRVKGLLSAEGVWDKGFQFGDWLDPTAPPENPFQAKADVGVVATACIYRSAVIASETATIIGDSALQQEFSAMATQLRGAFNANYVDDGVVHSDCATVYALAIVFGLLDGADLVAAGVRLAEIVKANGYHVATGFAGTPFVCDALVMTGHLDDAYLLLTEKTCPSWLYPVTMGATTIWERWDSMMPDGTINTGGMTSFNHYALGAVADFMHRVVGGVAPAEPGYRRVRIAPQPGGGLTWATTTLESPQGLISVAWRIESDVLTVEVELPDGVVGEFIGPDGSTAEVRGNEQVTAALAT